MKFGCTGVVGKEALIRFTHISDAVENFINNELQNSTLNKFDTDISYCPIVLSDEFVGVYPARSKMSHKQKIYYCSPKLNFETFHTGTLAEALNEFVVGLQECLPQIQKLGASDKQRESFRLILDGAKQLTADDLAENLMFDSRTKKHLGIVDKDK